MNNGIKMTVKTFADSDDIYILLNVIMKFYEG